MKYQLSKFREFLKTPFPYLFLLLCIFLASTLLGNIGFRKSFHESGNNSMTKNSERYELCLVCSGPGAHDALSDIGFTVANFVLFPVTAATTVSVGIVDSISKRAGSSSYLIYSVFLGLTSLYGVVLPFVIASVYEKIDEHMCENNRQQSVYSR